MNEESPQTAVSRDDVAAYAAWAGVHVLGVPLLAVGLAEIVRRRGRSGEARGEPASEADGPRERAAEREGRTEFG